MRLILCTGKGGVGKTTVAAATAVHLARSGRRVLVASTDPAHSLGDCLATPLGNEPRTLEPGLDALEIDTLSENDRAWERLRAYIARVMASTGTDDLLNRELLVLPGLSELFSLLRLLDLVDAAAHDVLIVDCAPSGETLSLLHYPDRLRRVFETLIPAKRRVAKVAGKPLEKLTGLPMPEDRLFDDVLTLTRRLRRLGTLLRDPDTATVRLVTTPERIPVAEARRDLTWLTMYGFTVDGIVLNRVYPDAALDGYFAPFAARQAAGIEAVEASFAHVPRWRLPLGDHEITGLDALAAAGDQLYADGPEADGVHASGDLFTLVRAGDNYELRWSLPDAAKESLDLQQDGDDLVLAYRGMHRRLQLPDSVRGRVVTRARYADQHLAITLAREI